MNHFTITSTLHKQQLPKLLAEIKSMVDASHASNSHDLHIKTIHIGKDDSLCKVTVNTMQVKPVIH
jgi:hypothetical protein